MYTVTEDGPALSLSTRIEHTHVIATLSAEIDIANAPALREQLLSLLCRAASRLVLDLSAVPYADASGLAVLVGIARRARLLGGFLRLAAPAPAVTEALRLTGLDRYLNVFQTVQAAITSLPGSQRQPGSSTDVSTDLSGAAKAGPALAFAGRAWHPAKAGELRPAIAAVLLHADAWRDADPRRQFTAALQALAKAYSGTNHAALTDAARALLHILARQPLTHSPAVAATASHLRRLLIPLPGTQLHDSQHFGAASSSHERRMATINKQWISRNIELD